MKTIFMVNEFGDIEKLNVEVAEGKIVSPVTEEEVAQNANLACLLGLHAWAGNVCVNCGKTK